jgi:hypothetical protein
MKKGQLFGEGCFDIIYLSFVLVVGFILIIFSFFVRDNNVF